MISRTLSPATVLSTGSSGSTETLAADLTLPTHISTLLALFTKTCTFSATPRSKRSSWRTARLSVSRRYLQSHSTHNKTSPTPSRLANRSLSLVVLSHHH